MLLSGGVLPSRDDFRRQFKRESPFGEEYRMELSDTDLGTLARVVNIGIDSHLEAVICTQEGRCVVTHGVDSLYTLVRRLVEDGEDDAHDLAGSILMTIGIEWV